MTESEAIYHVTDQKPVNMPEPSRPNITSEKADPASEPEKIDLNLCGDGELYERLGRLQTDLEILQELALPLMREKQVIQGELARRMNGK